MERMLVVVFDNEKKAFEGKSALHQLELSGDVAVYADAVIVKDAKGAVSVAEENDFGPVGTAVGTSLGTLIGLLGGPVGTVIGAGAGLMLGGLVDVDNYVVSDEFIREVSTTLLPTKVALVAQIEEDWTTPLDVEMEKIGGIVLRRALWKVRDDMTEQDIATAKADLAELKAELATADANNKAKLQKKVNEAQARIDAQQKKAKERRQEFEARQKSKREILKKNATAAGRALKALANTPV